jgi:ankyrin repeat protein
MLAATYTTNPETVLALLDAKVDDSRKDNEGRTALILADQNEKMRGTPAYRKLVEMATQRSLRDLMKAH